MASFGTFLTYLFFFTTGRRKDEAEVLLRFLILSVNVQIYIYIYIIHIYYRTLHGDFFITEHSTR